jgi:hypothetical protein
MINCKWIIIEPYEDGLLKNYIGPFNTIIDIEDYAYINKLNDDWEIVKLENPNEK